MYHWLVPSVVFPLYERLSGRRFWTEALRLRELQWRTPEELEARALQKLRPLLAHAIAQVPYYRGLFMRAGITPDDIRTLADLRHVPVTRKADLRANFPDRTTAQNLPPGRRWKMTTSGSTGFLFEFYTDLAGMDSWHSSYLFFLEWAGAALWDTRILVTEGDSPAYRANLPRPAWLTPSLRRVFLGERVIHRVGVDVTAAEYREVIRRLHGRRSFFIRGNPSHLARLAVQLLEDGEELEWHPKVVISGAETLTPANAAVLRKTFRCPVVNHYSTWEVPHIAQTCPDNPKVLHVNSERVILRVVRDDGTPAAPREQGRVVITSLTNYVMPFINYELGDRAVAGAACGCGRGLPSLLSIEGRLGEAIRTPAGKVITPGSLTNFLTFACQAVPYIWEYQAVQTGPGSVVLHVVPTPSFTPEVATALRARLEAFLGPNLTVRIETRDRIPEESSGKRLIIKSHLARS